jgi:branched-chain amino acid transport system substrate-binding protein
MNICRQLSLAAAAVALAWPSLAAAGPNSIKIGVLTDLSAFGSSAAGAGSVLAAQLAVEDFGARVLNKPIEVIQADMQSKPDLAVQIARRWYEAEAVDLIVDIPASAAAIAIQGMATQLNKMVIATVASSSDLTGKACTANAVHWIGNTPSLARSIVSALTAEGAKTWFLMMPDYQLGKDLVNSASPMIESLGGKVVETVYYPTNSTDYSQFLLRAQASGADVIGTGGTGLDLTNQVKQAVEFGVLPGTKQKLAAFVMNLADVNALGLKTLQGLYIMQEFYWDRDDQTRVFGRKFAARFNGRMPNFTHASNYSAILAYLKAVQAAGTDDPKTVVARMKADGVTRFGKPATIRQDGRTLFDSYAYRVKSPEESKEPWDYLRQVRTIAASDMFLPPTPDCSLNQ